MIQPGDTLSGIAWWFDLNGYRELYEANWEILGDDPNLIFPGQVITITGGEMKIGPADQAAATSG
ncbi:MAG: LysM domain-containing protein [Ilumatobacteraceae bacterium]